MTKEAAAEEPPRSMQLHPSRSLHRPDKNGQLPHVFMTLTGDIPLAELTLDDILEVNWNGVKTSIQDTIVRVRHEGDLSSTTVRDTIRLLALVLRKLDMADGEIGQRLEATPGIGFWGWILSLLPTEGSRRLRVISGDRRRLKRKRKQLDGHHDEIFDMRVELADEIDKKIGAMLAARDPEYRELLEKLQTFQATRTTAKSILDDLASLEKLEVKLVNPNDLTDGDVLRQKIRHLESKLPSFVAFCHRHGGELVRERGDVGLFVHELAAGLDAQASPLEQVMLSKRETWKQELYAEAVDQP
jgi:hypothetical protein